MEIKSIFGKVLFSSEAETWVQTLSDAIKSGANLRNADLINADLINADLINADLRNANLRNADLRNANLRNADLINANLSGADLINADLRNADLRNANLRNADLINADLRNADLINADLRNANLINADLSGAKNVETAKMPIYAKWAVAIEGEILHIGCKSKSFEEWEIWFNGTEEYSTERGTEDFKRLHAIFLAYKTYHEFMKS